MPLSLTQGDITSLPVFAIVNAANSSLAGGGGVDGMVHMKAGPQLLEECRGLSPCPPGEARVTRGYLLPARFVIHTVGPVWQGGQHGERDVLARAYRSCLAAASGQNGYGLVMPELAFPAISTGIYRFPLREACTIAAREAAAWLDAKAWPKRVIFCMYDARAHGEMRRALDALARPDLLE
jgi:O-acetyl-ADP-ribose deacetylase (regulator of RNase III)